MNKQIYVKTNLTEIPSRLLKKEALLCSMDEFFDRFLFCDRRKTWNTVYLL